MSSQILSANQTTKLFSKPEKPIKIGVFHSPPIIILEDNNPPTGLMIDFLQEIASRENWNIEWVEDSWANLLEKAKNREIDLITFIALREERAKYLDYTEENFITGWGQVYTHDKSLNQTIFDYDGKTVAILRNEVHGIGFLEECRAYNIECQTLEVSNFNTAFKMLQDKEVDGVVAGNWVGHDYLARYNIVPTSVTYNPQDSLFAVPKGINADIAETIDNYVANWRADKSSPYYQIRDKWFSHQTDSAIPKWLTTALLIITGLLFITAIATFILRQQVKKQTADLKRQNKQTRQIIDLIPHFIYAANDKGEVFLMNKYAADFCGIKLEDYDTLPKSRMLDKYGAPIALFEGDKVLLEHGKGSHKSEFKTISAQGDEFYFNLTKVPFISSSTDTQSVVGVGVDITTSKNYEKQIEHMSYHDPLTQLPNRILLNDRLKQSLALSVRQGYSGAALLIDLDDFKNINHNHGPQVGDQLLKIIAERMTNLAKVGDTIARLSSDSFVVQLNELPSNPELANNAAIQSAKEFQKVINMPLTINGKSLQVTASMGLVIYPIDGKSSLNIIPRAETAMRHAKLSGKNKVVRFTSDMETAVFQKHLISNELKTAISNDEFELYYQPQFHKSSFKPIGFEALIRWNHKKHGIVYPGDFIPAAEENNLVIPIGYWVIEQAFRQLQQWQNSELSEAFVGINLSVIQISDSRLISRVERLLAQYQVNPSLVEFEITETVLFQDIEKSLGTLKELKKLGFSLSVDDFGTGYSSLSYINQMPLDKLKIDRSFIKDIEKDKGSQAIVKNIVKMSEDLGLSVLAEGVEEKFHIEYLSSIGCKYYQGFYLSKAISAREVENIYCNQQAPNTNKSSQRTLM